MISERQKKNSIKHAKDHPDDTLYRFRRLGPLRTTDGIITVGHRMNKWIENNWNPTSWPLSQQDIHLLNLLLKQCMIEMLVLMSPLLNSGFQR